MIDIKFIFGLCFLIVLSLIDFWTYRPKDKGHIPSSLTTIFLVLALIIAGEGALFMGAVIGIIALFFAEQELYGGIADLKIIIACGLLLPSLLSVLVFGAVLSIIAVMLKSIILFKVTKGKNQNFPFIPLILISFLISQGVMLFL